MNKQTALGIISIGEGKHFPFSGNVFEALAEANQRISLSLSLSLAVPYHLLIRSLFVRLSLFFRYLSTMDSSRDPDPPHSDFEALRDERDRYRQLYQCANERFVTFEQKQIAQMRRLFSLLTSDQRKDLSGNNTLHSLVRSPSIFRRVSTFTSRIDQSSSPSRDETFRAEIRDGLGSVTQSGQLLVDHSGSNR